MRTARFALAVATAWMLWEVFGGGVAWLASAATWAAGTLLLVTIVVGLAMYFSPRFRRILGTGVRRLVSWATRGLRRRR